MPPWRQWKIEGELKIVVLPVEFSDNVHSQELELIDQHMNEMNHYFEEVSHGKVTLTWTLEREWKMLSGTMDFYGEEAKRGIDKNFDVLVKDSLKVWSEVTYRSYGYVMVVHAGQDQSDTHRDNDIWSACYFSAGHIQKLTDPVFGEASQYVWSVAVVSEYSEMGTFAHEFAHALGLPDLYNYNDHSSFVGNWSLMDHGDWLGSPEGSCPSYLEAWSQIHLGWIAYEQWMPNQTRASWRINPLESEDGIRTIKVPLSRFTYYLVEVRKRIGFDQSLPGEGVLITSIDDTLDSGEGIVKPIDSKPDTDTIDDALFSVGTTFSDPNNSVYISVRDSLGHAYEIDFSNEKSIFTTTTISETNQQLTTSISSETSSLTVVAQPFFASSTTFVGIAVMVIVAAIVGITLAKRRSTAKYCTSCGHRLPSDSEFCSKCGSKQN